jgi:cytochrome oxidase Cu insertion factor (SCO1/SenC/PrrC family)
MKRTLLVLVAVVTILFVILLLRTAPREPPPILATLPAFELLERDGSTIAKRDLAGAPWIADFIFTRCAVACPRLTVRMKELRTRLPPEIRTVSFSVDPEHDTPEVLSDYARHWQIEGREWLFLTGTREEVWTLVRQGFLLPVEDAPEVEASPILHSNRFVLVDGAGRIRSSYEAFEEDALDRLLADLRALLAAEGG